MRGVPRERLEISFAAAVSSVRGRVTPTTGNDAPGGAVGPDVHRWTNGVKTALLLGLMGGLVLGAGWSGC